MMDPTKSRSFTLPDSLSSHRSDIASQPLSAREQMIDAAIQAAGQLLPTNGSLRYFRHQNPLRGLDDLPFRDAVQRASTLFGASVYLPEHEYCGMLIDGRLTHDDLVATLRRDLGHFGDEEIAGLATRTELRAALLRLAAFNQAVRSETRAADSMAEGCRQRSCRRKNSVRSFHPAASVLNRQLMVRQVQRWLDDVSVDEQPPERSTCQQQAKSIWKQLTADGRRRGSRNQLRQEVCLRMLRSVCHRAGQAKVAGAARYPSGGDILNTVSGIADADLTFNSVHHHAVQQTNRGVRHREMLLRAVGTDTDQMVETIMVPFLSGFLDQGQVRWQQIDRDAGLLRSFAELHANQSPTQGWLTSLQTEFQQLASISWNALRSISHSLELLGVEDAEISEYVQSTVLALPGWAGIVQYLEADADWMPWQVPPGTFFEFVALRLTLDRLAVRHVSRSIPGFSGALSELRALSAATAHVGNVNEGLEPPPADLLFQLAQIEGWLIDRLWHLTEQQWDALHTEVLAFPMSERLRCFQEAFEERQRRYVLDAISVHSIDRRNLLPAGVPSMQVVCCTDPCTESLRRHLEEVCPGCETFGTPGFFGLAMKYRALGETHFIPHCPPNVKSRHFVQEVPGFNPDGTSQRNPRALNNPPRKSPFRTVEFSSLLENWLSTPWLTRLLFPRITKRLERLTLHRWHAPHSEQLDWEGRMQDDNLQGYTLEEMVDAVQRLLTDTGLTAGFAPIVLLVGHTSSSVNNPYSAADNCSFCGGRSSGPNARTMALMANDHRVRAQLKQEGPAIPDDTIFVAVEHHTGSDTVEYFDLTHLSLSQKQQLPAAMDAMDEALRRNAHERCRRFEAIPLDISFEQAAAAVEDRSSDLSQICAEYSYAANAVCIIGRRERSRGLFLDRRAFLVSYNPEGDDEEGTILGRLLKTAIPTCSAVNLQYYFSRMDPERFGAGSKLTHSVVSMLGVTTGPQSDLCSGLPQQMVRLHEPRRMMCIIESTPAVVGLLLEQNPTLRRWCNNQWLFLATLDPNSGRIHCMEGGSFHRFEAQRSALPEVPSSTSWYQGLREHLSIASIRPPSAGRQGRRQT